MTTRRTFRRAIPLALTTTTMLILSVGCRGAHTVAPSPIATALSITYAGGGPIFIGNAVQLEAREMLSDGTTRVVTGLTWRTDAATVADVSTTGLVTAVAAGEATISVDSPARATLRLRVLPNFAGAWSGTEVVIGCQDSEGLDGLCDDLLRLGTVGTHQSSFTQAAASVDARIDTGGGSQATTTGDITVGGLLQLSPAQSRPESDGFAVRIEKWQSRADSQSRMTGTYDLVFVAADMTGVVRMNVRLDDVRRAATAGTAAFRDETKLPSLGGLWQRRLLRAAAGRQS
jgi:hypothetical protein